MNTKGNEKGKLTAKQKKFCLLYATKADFFGNGVKAYIEAYKVDLTRNGKYESAKTNAWRLLTNADILKEIDMLLEKNGLNDAFIDKQLSFLVHQNAELGVKLRAIQEYNRLKKRYTESLKVDLNVEPVNLSNFRERLKNMSLEELQREVGEQARRESLENWK